MWSILRSIFTENGYNYPLWIISDKSKNALKELNISEMFTIALKELNISEMFTIALKKNWHFIQNFLCESFHLDKKANEIHQVFIYIIKKLKNI